MRPTVILKAAMTMDGQIAAADGTSQWITSPEARRDGHELRSSVDAVMVGAGTVVADNPRLDVRLDGYDGRQPTPVVVAGRRPLPTDAAVFGRNPIIISAEPLELPGRVLVVDQADGGADLRHALELLADLGIRRVLVEGGAGLAARMLSADLIDEGVFYLGPRLAGGVGRPAFAGVWETLDDSRSVEVTSIDRVGVDIRVGFTIA